MRLVIVRKANIDGGLRKRFERYGEGTLQFALGSSNPFQHEGVNLQDKPQHDALLAWLTERFDLRERREDWLMLMEAGITIFVFVETAIAVVSAIKHGF